MNKIKQQIYQNIIDSIRLVNDYKTVDHLIPSKDDDKVLEEMSYTLVSLLRQKPERINIELLSPKQYTLLPDHLQNVVTHNMETT